jgi:uncharacterized membrane protein
MNKADLFYKPLLKEAWVLAKKYYWIIFVFLLINITVSFSFAKAGEKYFAIALFSIIVSVIFKFWSQRFSVWVASKKDFKFIDIFNGFDNFKKYFVTSLIYGLIILGGFILLIVPGIIWALKYFLAPYFSIDKGMGYKEALKASAEATKGVKTKIFLLMLLMGAMVIVSIIPFFLGLLVTIPLCFVVTGLLYVRLSGNTENVVVTDDIVAQPLEIPAETDAEVLEPVVTTQQ